MVDSELYERCVKDIKSLQEDVVDMKQWRAEHDGRINVWWHNQHEWDEDIEKRVVVLERVVWKALGAAAVVLLVGNLAIQYLMK